MLGDSSILIRVEYNLMIAVSWCADKRICHKCYVGDGDVGGNDDCKRFFWKSRVWCMCDVIYAVGSQV